MKLYILVDYIIINIIIIIQINVKIFNFSD